jgi:zinc/manganese transport system substrate-binding protein/manganese/iron transport system substrate-binding protein
MRRVFILLISVVMLAVGASCGSSNKSSAAATNQSTTVQTVAPGGTLRVVTTTTQITDFATTVGANKATIYAVLKPNVDPHDYEPTPADLDAIAKADVVIQNGVGLEKWFQDTLKSANPKGLIVDASKGVSLRKALDGSGEDDPHIWHNPQNAKTMVKNIGAAFGTVDPANKSTYDKAVGDYSAQLDQIDSEIKGQLGTLTNKKVVTNHDALGYYVEHYGLTYVGSIIPSFDTQTELSQKDINDLVAKIKSQGVKAVFSESSLPPKTSEAISKEAGVKVVEGADALYADSMGTAGSDGDTYLKMERHNTKAFVDNLR